MDNSKYTKNHKQHLSKSKTRSIGINTEENYIKCTCHIGDVCPKILLVPCLPYYYPMCTNSTNNNCSPPNLNINPNILNQYQFVHSANDFTKNVNKCDNLSHCCSASNCTSSECANLKMNATEPNDYQMKPEGPVRSHSQEIGSKNNKKHITLNEKHSSNTFSPESCANYASHNEIREKYCDEDMTRFATELLDKQNYKTNQDFDQIIKVKNERSSNEEKKMLNNLLTPNRRKCQNTVNNTVDESDDCVDSENDDEISSLEGDEQALVPVIKAPHITDILIRDIYAANEVEEKERIRPSTADGRMRNNFDMFKNFSKPNSANKTTSDLEMLMMLKAFVNQTGDKDVNPKLNQLINHLSSQETSLRSDGQIDCKKSTLPRK